MASAFFDPRARQWVASIGTLHRPGRRRLRIPVAQVPGVDTAAAKAAADAYASECDSLRLRCESQPLAETIDRAEALGAIRHDQAAALRIGKVPPQKAPASRRRITVQDAARMHPTTRRESPAEAKRHLRELDAYVAWAGTDRLGDLTAERASQYVEHLQRQGFQYDGRRHAIMWLRRAARMAAGLGYPDALSGLVLDRQDRGTSAPQAWTFAELGQLTRAAARLPDPRLLAVVLLGGWCGLRDSEMFRMQVGDLDGDVLAIGVRQSKTKASRRDIPLPGSAAAVLGGLAEGQPSGAPLLRPRSWRTERSRADGAFCAHTFPKWFARTVWGDPASPPRTPVPGKVPPSPPRVGCLPGLRRLPPKCLRKTYMSWVFRQGLHRDQAERYAGHKLSAALSISERHYIADLMVAELRPFACDLEARIAAVYSSMSTALQPLAGTG